MTERLLYDPPLPQPPSDDSVVMRRWFMLAAGSLVVAGFFAAFLIVGRAPFFGFLTADPGFFKRCLVVHVNLSLVAWFYAFVAGLFRLVPSQGGGFLSRQGVWVSATGVILLIVAAGINGAEPVLSNYVPMIDHPMFAAGLVVFAFGVAMSFLDPRLLPAATQAPESATPHAAHIGLRAAAVAFVLALLTFAGSWLSTSRTYAPQAYYEHLFWGGGHVLQFASVMAMVAVWILLLTPVLGRSPVSARLASFLFALLVLPLLAAPILAAQGPGSIWYRQGFTMLMQWGIFPIVTVFLGLSVRALWQARKAGTLHKPLSDLRVVGFAASAALTVAGFVLGALIRGSNTMVPAHYHAAIGAVTAAFMAVTYVLLEPMGLRLPTPKTRSLARIQAPLFAAGQLLFALGFGFAGAHGMGRKVYGAEQHIRTTAEYAGLTLMGVGGLVAMASGILFLGLLAICWRTRPRCLDLALDSTAERNPAWKNTTESIPSRS